MASVFVEDYEVTLQKDDPEAKEKQSKRHEYLRTVLPVIAESFYNHPVSFINYSTSGQTVKGIMKSYDPPKSGNRVYFTGGDDVINMVSGDRPQFFNKGTVEVLVDWNTWLRTKKGVTSEVTEFKVGHLRLVDPGMGSNSLDVLGKVKRYAESTGRAALPYFDGGYGVFLRDFDSPASFLGWFEQMIADGGVERREFKLLSDGSPEQLVYYRVPFSLTKSGHAMVPLTEAALTAGPGKVSDPGWILTNVNQSFTGGRPSDDFLTLFNEYLEFFNLRAVAPIAAAPSLGLRMGGSRELVVENPTKKVISVDNPPLSPKYAFDLGVKKAEIYWPISHDKTVAQNADEAWQDVLTEHPETRIGEFKDEFMAGFYQSFYNKEDPEGRVRWKTMSKEELTDALNFYLKSEVPEGLADEIRRRKMPVAKELPDAPIKAAEAQMKVEEQMAGIKEEPRKPADADLAKAEADIVHQQEMAGIKPSTAETKSLAQSPSHAKETGEGGITSKFKEGFGKVASIMSGGAGKIASLLKFKKNPDSLVLDIRTLEEYEKGHVPDAILVPTPLPPLDDSAVSKLKRELRRATRGVSKNHPINVYCRKGVRAAKAAEILLDMGFTNVENLGGVETDADVAETATEHSPAVTGMLRTNPELAGGLESVPQHMWYRAAGEEEMRQTVSLGHAVKSEDLLGNDEEMLQFAYPEAIQKDDPEQYFDDIVPDWANVEGVTTVTDLDMAVGHSWSLGERGGFVLVFDASSVKVDDTFDLADAYFQFRYPEQVRLIGVLQIKGGVYTGYGAAENPLESDVGAYAEVETLLDSADAILESEWSDPVKREMWVRRYPDAAPEDPSALSWDDVSAQYPAFYNSVVNEKAHEMNESLRAANPTRKMMGRSIGPPGGRGYLGDEEWAKIKRAFRAAVRLQRASPQLITVRATTSAVFDPKVDSETQAFWQYAPDDDHGEFEIWGMESIMEEAGVSAVVAIEILLGNTLVERVDLVDTGQKLEMGPGVTVENPRPRGPEPPSPPTPTPDDLRRSELWDGWVDYTPIQFVSAYGNDEDAVWRFIEDVKKEYKTEGIPVDLFDAVLETVHGVLPNPARDVPLVTNKYNVRIPIQCDDIEVEVEPQPDEIDTEDNAVDSPDYLEAVYNLGVKKAEKDYPNVPWEINTDTAQSADIEDLVTKIEDNPPKYKVRVRAKRGGKYYMPSKATAREASLEGKSVGMKTRYARDSGGWFVEIKESKAGRTRTGRRRKRNPDVAADQAKYWKWLNTLAQRGEPLPNPEMDIPVTETGTTEAVVTKKKIDDELDRMFSELDFDELESIGFEIWDATGDDEIDERLAEIRAEWNELSVEERMAKLKSLGKVPTEKALLGHPYFNVSDEDPRERHEGSSESEEWEEEEE